MTYHVCIYWLEGNVNAVSMVTDGAVLFILIYMYEA